MERVEVPLVGGRITRGVVRRGDHVLRPCNANSPFAHETLHWLERKGVGAAPKFIGLADDGREITSFLKGIAPTDLGTYDGRDDWRPSEGQLFAAGTIIKKLHEALSDYPGCPDGFTVCHNDLSPCNFMFENGLPYAVFDWDAAGVGEPVADLAYAAWMWSSIGENERTARQKGREIKTLLDAYGLSKAGRDTLAEKIRGQMRRVGKSFAARGNTDGLRWVRESEDYLIKNEAELSKHFRM
ncbi:MAG: phosphotransferase [Defluviitaleaceae bacterium]|nr:phosphotransferase [Defluviitaleaceae bacterium]